MLMLVKLNWYIHTCLTWTRSVTEKKCRKCPRTCPSSCLSFYLFTGIDSCFTLWGYYIMGLYNIIILQLNPSACWVWPWAHPACADSVSDSCLVLVVENHGAGVEDCARAYHYSLPPSLPPGLKRKEGLQDFSSSPWDDFTGTCQVCLLLCSLQPMKSSERARPDEGVTRSSAGGSCLAMTAK